MIDGVKVYGKLSVILQPHVDSINKNNYEKVLKEKLCLC
jgi:hypothetical protein